MYVSITTDTENIIINATNAKKTQFHFQAPFMCISQVHITHNFVYSVIDIIKN